MNHNPEYRNDRGRRLIVPWWLVDRFGNDAILASLAEFGNNWHRATEEEIARG